MSNQISLDEWNNTQAASKVQRQNPHKRLDSFSEKWAAREASLAEWGEWSKFVEERLLKLLDAMLPDNEQARAIEESMLAAVAIQSTKSTDMADLQEKIANHKGTLADLKDALAEVAAGLSLSVVEGTVPERKQKLILAQGKSEQYQQTKRDLREAETEKLIKQAHYDSAEREYKRLGEQIKNLRARLEHWTARTRMIQGESK